MLVFGLTLVLCNFHGWWMLSSLCMIAGVTCIIASLYWWHDGTQLHELQLHMPATYFIYACVIWSFLKTPEYVFSWAQKVSLFYFPKIIGLWLQCAFESCESMGLPKTMQMTMPMTLPCGKCLLPHTCMPGAGIHEQNGVITYSVPNLYKFVWAEDGICWSIFEVDVILKANLFDNLFNKFRLCHVYIWLSCPCVFGCLENLKCLLHLIFKDSDNLELKCQSSQLLGLIEDNHQHKQWWCSCFRGTSIFHS